jgi:hypothetical protein
MSVPAIVIRVPVESRAFAYLDCDGIEEEDRIAVDVATRDLTCDVLRALLVLFEALTADGEGSW